ncbi:MAG: glycoside hydrolase family 25 protein [Ruminococcus sp.]|nr:glycoside hydrolase family 25 protein [Ruminococcus sp.]
MTMKGIDVSTYQCNVDYKKLKADGVEFVIIRASYGDVLSFPSQKDPMFESHYKAATAAGLHVGAYHFTYALTPEKAKREAQGFMSVIKGKKFDMPVYIDLESEPSSGYQPFKTGKANCSAMVKAFCDELEKNNYWAGLYISRSPLQDYITTDVANRYSLWVAEYASKCNYSGTVDIWQYTSSARFNGYNGNLDADICYKDYPTLIKNAGKNGYPKPTKVLDPKGMKQGDKNLGVYELKSLLSLAESKKIITTHITVDDGFGSGTTAVVNELLRKWGYKPNGIAGQGFVKRLTELLR